MCLAGNVDYLLDDVTGLVGFCPLPESDDSSDNVSKRLSEENEDEESDENLKYLCTMWTRSCYLIVPL